MKATLLGTVSNHNNSIIHGLRKVTNVLNRVSFYKNCDAASAGEYNKIISFN